MHHSGTSTSPSPSKSCRGETLPLSSSTAIGVKPRDSSSLLHALDDALHSLPLAALQSLAGAGERDAGVLAPRAAAPSAPSRVSLGVHVRVGSRTTSSSRPSASPARATSSALSARWSRWIVGSPAT